MTRPLSDVLEVLALAEQGLSKRAISLRTGVARASIREWLADPEHACKRGRFGTGGEPCFGRCEPWRDLSEQAYAYLLGAYLGDGTISKSAKNVFRLRIFCCDAYPGIMDETQLAMEAVVQRKVGRVQRVGCTEVGCYSKHWPCLFPQYGPGMKHERLIVLADWQQEIADREPRLLLRGLIHSDGCRANNFAVVHRKDEIKRYYYPRYHFSNVSTDIQKIFCDTCDLLNIRWKRAKPTDITVNRRADVAFMDSFIGPKR